MQKVVRPAEFTEEAVKAMTGLPVFIRQYRGHSRPPGVGELPARAAVFSEDGVRILMGPLI